MQNAISVEAPMPTIHRICKNCGKIFLSLGRYKDKCKACRSGRTKRIGVCLDKFKKTLHNKNMKIHKALKVKNRLAGEVVALQEIFKRENSRRSDNTSQVNVENIFLQLEEKRTELFKLKGSIAQATAPITPLLAELEESKSEKNFFSGMPTRDGEELISQGIGNQPLKYTWSAWINRSELDLKLASLQDKINTLQDSIDEFNSRTDVVL